MKTFASSAGLIFAVMSCSSVCAQEVPRFDIEASCRHAKALTAEDKSPYDGCVRDETSARNELTAIWAASSRQPRETCAQETTIGGPPSYVELLVCLQMYSANAPASRPPHRLRARQ